MRASSLVATPSRNHALMIIILMGVAGAGKTTIGRLLADELGWPFLDGDDFRSAAIIEKMARGTALTDADRELWLRDPAGADRRPIAEGRSGIIACSALKQTYRGRLATLGGQVRFVYLKASYDLGSNRLQGV